MPPTMRYPSPSMNTAYYMPANNGYYDSYSHGSSMGYYSHPYPVYSSHSSSPLDMSMPLQYPPMSSYARPRSYYSTVPNKNIQKPYKSDKVKPLSQEYVNKASTHPSHYYTLPPLPSVYPPPDVNKSNKYSHDYLESKSDKNITLTDSDSHSLKSQPIDEKNSLLNEKIELKPLKHQVNNDFGGNTLVNDVNEISQEISSADSTLEGSISHLDSQERILELEKEKEFDLESLKLNQKRPLLDHQNDFKQEAKRPRVEKVEKGLEDEARLLIFLSQGKTI